MSWFEEQLRYREETDNADFESAIDSIAGAVMGTRLKSALDNREIASSAAEQILKYYRCKSKKREIPQQLKTAEEQIEYLMKPFGIMSRTVTLDKGWYHHASGAMIGTLKEDGSAVALIPGKLSGYLFCDIKTGKWVRLNKKTEKLLDTEALFFYKPLPRKSLGMMDLLRFMMEQLSLSDIVLYVMLLGCSAALGLLSPMFTKWLFSDVLASKDLQILLALFVFMSCFTLSRLCFSVYQSLIQSRITIKQDIFVQSAVMSRILSLPAKFFRQYSAGELTQKASYVQSLCSTLFNAIGGTGLTSVFSLVYIAQIFTFAPSLVVPSLIITVGTVTISLITTFMQMKITRTNMDESAKTSGLTYSTITGIQKIKLAGAEKRMFSRWAKHFAEDLNLEYNSPLFLRLSSTITLALSLAGTLIIYFVAIKSRITVADYYAFTTAYGMVSAAFMSISSIAVSVANIRPTLEMVKPILETEPETLGEKEIVTSLRGNIELSHVSFKYDDAMPNVIDDLSLTIPSGQYLAVVGSTGCGKSTLLRLLLGFETPQKGSIYYDKKDITRIDISSLRQKIGVCMQDGKLFLGDIFSNIIISAPQLTLDDAWKAAEIASIADDIRDMPMGMNTIISEGQGGISGGQKQRLMIARAVAPSPKILMFDEATSALDNITQKKVSDAIDSLNCTRIIIAHRLSTIRNADRIIFFENGRIAEDGTYDELIAKNGLFAKLVERQRTDVDSE